MLNLIVAAGHVRERVDRVCSRHGITMGQYNVLRILRGVHPAGHPRCEIIRRMLERAPDVTRLVDRLEKQKLVSRDRSERDRRLSLTRITPKGLRLLETIEPALEREVQREFSERVSRDDCRELSRICESIYGE
jgi:MarR family transcriptional regulator, 2-MHQ and catechol-resistance regulon repressor